MATTRLLLAALWFAFPSSAYLCFGVPQNGDVICNQLQFCCDTYDDCDPSVSGGCRGESSVSTAEPIPFTSSTVASSPAGQTFLSTNSRSTTLTAASSVSTSLASSPSAIVGASTVGFSTTNLALTSTVFLISYDLPTTYYATRSLTSGFTPPSSCFAPTYILSPAGNDILSSVSGSLIASKPLSRECYPSFFANQTYTGPSSSSVTARTFFNNQVASEYGTAAGAPPSITVTYSATIYGAVTIFQSYYAAEGCPTGFTSATGGVVGNVTSTICCPSSFHVPSLGYNQAVICEASSRQVQILGTVTSLPSSVASTSVALTATSTTRIAASTASASSSTRVFYEEALPVIVVSLPPTTSSPGSTPGVSNITTNTDASSARTLSTGAQAGIGVGSAIGGLAILGALAYFCTRRMRSKKTAGAGRMSGEDAHFEKAELPGQAKSLHEADGTVLGHEIENKPRVELQGDSHAELEGSWGGWEMPGGQQTSHVP